MARLREGRANTTRGAAHFLRETVGRVRYAGASGPLTVRADSGFYNQKAMVTTCRETNGFSITIRQRQTLHNQIEATYPRGTGRLRYPTGWTAADVAAGFESAPDAAPVRLIVRRAAHARFSTGPLGPTTAITAGITDRDGGTLELEADHRGRAEIENAIRDLKYGWAQSSRLRAFRRQRRLAGWRCSSWPTTWGPGRRHRPG